MTLTEMKPPSWHDTKKTRPERIMAWVVDQWNPNHVDSVYQDLIDVATGTREGNRFEREALERIFPND